MKKIKSLFMTTLITLGVAQQSAVVLAESSNTNTEQLQTKAVDNNSSKEIQSVDDWMPDKNLQRYLLDKFADAFPSGEITKEDIHQNLNDPKFQVAEMRQYGIKDLTGLEDSGYAVFYLDYNDDDLSYIKTMNSNFYNVFGWDYTYIIGDENKILDLDQFNNYVKNMKDTIYHAFIQGNVVSKQLVSKENYKSIPVDINYFMFTLDLSDSDYGSYKPIEDGEEFSFLINGKTVTYRVSNYNYESEPIPGIESNFFKNHKYSFNLDLVSDVNYSDLANGLSDAVYMRNLQNPDPKAPFDVKGLIQLQFAPEQGANVVAHYQNEDGDKISSDEVLQGTVGSAYETEQKNIAGYTFKEVKGNPKGTFTNDEQVVIYVYVRNAMPVHVKYVDIAGNEIAQGYDITGEVGDKQIVDKKDIDGYTFKEFFNTDDTNGNITLSDKGKTVKVIYSRDVAPVEDAKPVHVTYVDEDGNEISKSDNYDITGKVGDKKQAERKYVQGYTFKEFQDADDAQGNVTLSKKERTVKVVYTKFSGDSENDGNKNPKPGTNGNDGSSRTNVTSRSRDRHLPQTGEDIRNASILSIIGAMIVATTGYLTFWRKKRN